MQVTRARWCAVAAIAGTIAAAACSSDPPAPSADAASGGAGGAGSGGTSSGGTGSGGKGSGGRATGGTGTGGKGSGGASSGGRPGSGGAASGGNPTGTGGAASGGAITDAAPEASPCAACPSGACLPDGTCVECNVDRDCKGALTHCSPAHECVVCLPGEKDDCASGSYCELERTSNSDGGGPDGGDTADGGGFEETYSCKPGCKNNADCAPGICTASHVCTECNPSGTDTCAAHKYCAPDGVCLAGCKADGTDCASGVCNGSHECTSCISDAECLAPHTCATGTCMAPCTLAADCVGSGTADCCAGKCRFVSRDHDACLVCGTACGAKEFCSATGCSNATLAKVCDSPTVTFLLDGLQFDDQLTGVVSPALVSACPTAITARTLPQATAGTINGTTGQPVVGSGDMQVVIGGPYGQRLIRYLDTQGITTVFNASAERSRFQYRNPDGSAGAYIVDEPSASVTEAHDYFLVETVVEPVSGTLMLALHGFQVNGTIAAAWFFLNTMLPARATYDKSYYVYEWTNADSDAAPSAGDTYQLLASGP